jgi:tricorn protease
MSSRFICFALLLSALSARGQGSQAKPYFYDASLSADGRELAFVSGGDIWTTTASGGEAHLLIAHPAMETRPMYSPDGKYLAFNSARSGNGDIYLLNLATAKLSRLTYDDAYEELNGWSADGKYVYFSSTGGDIAGMRDIYRVKTSGGTPMAVSDRRYVTEAHAAPSPDGHTLAMTAKGMGVSQWWRNGHSHIDESEIWLMDEQTGVYKMLAGMGAKQLWPMWSADGGTVYYMSDRDGKENIWMHPVNGNATQVTHFKEGRLSFPSISKDGRTIVFEHDFAIWKLDLATGSANPVSISLRGAGATPAPEFQKLTSGFTDLAVSPDGKKLAVIVQGELFVVGAKDGGEATRITFTTGMESSPVWSKGSNILYYTVSKKGANAICKYNFPAGKETQLTDAGADEGSLTLSPDGKKLAFIRRGKDLMVLDLETKEETLVAKGNMSFSPVSSQGTVSWSPDNRWIAYSSFGDKSFRNVYAVPVNGGQAKPVSFLANTFGGAMGWGKDGSYILFATANRTEPGQVVRVDLQPKQPIFQEDQFRELFADKENSKKIISKDNDDDDEEYHDPIVWKGLRDRFTIMPLGVDVDDIEISKDKNTLLVMATVGGQTNLYTYSLDELAKDAPVLKQLTFTPGSKSNMQFANNDKDVYFLEGRKVHCVNLESKTTKPVSITAAMNLDFAERKMEVFRQTWDLQNKGFYDEHFHGTDWQAVKKTYAPLAAGAQTPDELRRLLNMMVGELNASHSGVSSGVSPDMVTGHLGLKFDRKEYEQNGRYKITEVIDQGPAALTGKVHEGDYLIAVDGTEPDDHTDLNHLLENKLNKRVSLTVDCPDNVDDDVEVAVKPVNINTEKGMLYQQWVAQNRKAVSKMSNGRLGYLHMADMSQASLDKLYLDIDAQTHNCDAVVIDIRNNNGGFVNAYALDVLSRKGYMTMTARGMPAAPARIQLGQRALDAPTILLTNQHSLSDAEDFSEGYRALGLGKIVGEPTAGWIIYTGGETLFDGTVVRLPFIKITDAKGQDMELAPRPVDIKISNRMDSPDDLQLQRAVQELMKQISKG